MQNRFLISAASMLVAITCLAQPSGDVRKVKISFLPPPVDGAISVGIYDEWGQIVRVLHQEAELDEFTVGADALMTSWDGKDNDGFDRSPGIYRARGFVVPRLAIKQVEGADPGGAEAASVRLKLVANPLEKNERANVEIAVGFDDENAFLKTTDGLPLQTLLSSSDVTKVALTAGRDNKLLTVSISDGSNIRRMEVSGLEKMMGFDCGEIELK